MCSCPNLVCNAHSYTFHQSWSSDVQHSSWNGSSILGVNGHSYYQAVNGDEAVVKQRRLLRPALKLTEHIECQENGLPVPLGTSAPKQARCHCNHKNKSKEPEPAPEIVMECTLIPEQEPKPEESGDKDADSEYEHKMDKYLNDKEGAQGGWGGSTLLRKLGGQM
ncbi:hypothetical protein BDQ12DRAFT_671025 [Crucibulum laeve]|uniref:Uncharacterized protein n=1 Tax=Crucibulum laeve TaxID=68775 RepID=A0A5C3LJQ1_9AGAR|nr:hypothetical protein BDQ12DRAFT_671025 [Crucibulum laeve]